MNWHMISIILVQLACPVFQRFVTEIKYVKGHKDCAQYRGSVGTLSWKVVVDAGNILADCRLENPLPGLEYTIVWTKTVGSQPEKLVQKCTKKQLIRLKGGSLSCKYTPPFIEGGHLTCFVVSDIKQNMRTRCASDRIAVNGTIGRTVYPPKRTTKQIKKLTPLLSSPLTDRTMGYTASLQTSFDSNTVIPLKKQGSSLYVLSIQSAGRPQNRSAAITTTFYVGSSTSTRPTFEIVENVVVSATTMKTTNARWPQTRRRHPEPSAATMGVSVATQRRRYPDLNAATRGVSVATQRHRQELYSATRGVSVATQRRQETNAAASTVDLIERAKTATLRPLLARFENLKVHEEDYEEGDDDDDTVAIEGWFLRMMLVVIGLIGLVIAGTAIGKSLALKYYNRSARDCCQAECCTPCPAMELKEDN